MIKEEKYVQKSIKNFILNSLNDNLKNFELIEGGQQRTVGDLIESKVSEVLHNSKNSLISEKKTARSKKSIEDLTLVANGVNYYIDPKTHNINSDFSMPNLTSIEKIKKLFSSKNEDLIYIFVTYQLSDKIVVILNIKVLFIWEINLDCLGIGALGKGQLQLKDASKEISITNKTKEEWYIDFKKLVNLFLERQILKINKQIKDWK